MKYRVDRTQDKTVPIGMNSILYYGTSFKEATNAFHNTQVGLTPWNKEDASYGVLLSSWTGNFSATDTIIDFKI